MTDSATIATLNPPPEAPAAADPAAATNPRARTRRGGKGQRGRKSSGEASASGAPEAAVARMPSQPRPPRQIPPTLEKLAQLYPQLFGAVFLPLKRGIFQDLMAAHPEVFEREDLKQALGLHTRSTRYLQCVAAGQPRHDLQGQPVEPLAPEHIHHALLETHRRRQGRSSEDLRPKLRARILKNLQVSGLSREDYAERVRTRDDAANAILDEALAELAAQTARDEALLRAFEASGQTVEAFADMYGMDPQTVAQTLDSARQRALAVVAATTNPPDESASTAAPQP